MPRGAPRSLEGKDGASPSPSTRLPKPGAHSELGLTETLTGTLREQSAVCLWMGHAGGAPTSGANEFSSKSSKLCSFTPESSAERVEMSFSGPQQQASQRPGVSY